MPELPMIFVYFSKKPIFFSFLSSKMKIPLHFPATACILKKDFLKTAELL